MQYCNARNFKKRFGRSNRRKKSHKTTGFFYICEHIVIKHKLNAKRFETDVSNPNIFIL